MQNQTFDNRTWKMPTAINNMQGRIWCFLDMLAKFQIYTPLALYTDTGLLWMLNTPDWTRKPVYILMDFNIHNRPYQYTELEVYRFDG